MNCIYLKQKLNRKLECKKDKNKIIPKDCENCILKTYKCTELNKNCAKRPKKPDLNKEYLIKSNSTKLKTRTSKLSKLERNRTSLFTDNKDKCMFCSSTYQLTWHEIYSGRNRQNSMKYKLCLRMCKRCHEEKQNDKDFNAFWHKKGQAMFNKTYPDLDFEKIFKRNYL